MSTQDKRNGEFGGGARFLVFLFGLYLLFGAASTAYGGKLFAGFPPQLDIAYFIFGASTVGAYVEAVFAALLGLVCVGGALAGGQSNAP